MKRLVRFLLFIFVIIFVYIIVLIVPRDYEVDYIVNRVKINEKYNKELKRYEFVFVYDSREYPLVIDGGYSFRQKHISNIDINEDNQDTCLDITYNDSFYYICSDSDGLKDYRLVNSDLYDSNYPVVNNNSLIVSYNGIDIYDKSNVYLIWNYNGYIRIGDSNSKLELFDVEKYTSSYSYQSGNYLVIPDYDSDYFFKMFYVYDVLSNKLKSIEFDYEISYNLLYLGTYKNCFYFLDLKNKNEYVINFKNYSIKLINENDNDGLFYNGDKLVVEKVDTLVKNEEKFPEEFNKYSYLLDNNCLYQVINGYRVRVSNLSITSIISQIGDTVYYLVDDCLYSYSYSDGERLLLRYKEWKFNYRNQIFIFNI